MNNVDENEGLVGAQACINKVFPDEFSRPSMRSFKQWQYNNQIPFVKIGRRVFYSPSEVTIAITKNFTRRESV